VLELDAGGVGCEVPVCLGVVEIAMPHPGGDLFGQCLLVWNAPIEALAGQDGQFGLGEIEPRAVLGGVVPFEALDQAAGFGGGEGLIERCLHVGCLIASR
jgi:hypothetical protein